MGCATSTGSKDAKDQTPQAQQPADTEKMQGTVDKVSHERQGENVSADGSTASGRDKSEKTDSRAEASTASPPSPTDNGQPVAQVCPTPPVPGSSAKVVEAKVLTERKVIQDDTVQSKGRIAMIAQGTRGDCQPYVALTLGLRKAGFQVRLYTHKNYRKTFADPFGIDMFPIDYDNEEAFSNDPMLREAMAEGDLEKYLKSQEESSLVETKVRCWKEVFDNITETYKPMLVLGGITCTELLNGIAEKHGIPFVLINLTAFHPSKEYPSMMADILLGSYWPTFLNQMSHDMMIGAVVDGYKNPKHPANMFRKEIGLEGSLQLAVKYSWGQPSNSYQLTSISKELFQKPTDWPEHFEVTGPLFIPETEEVSTMAPPSEELKLFLNAGEPPVYIGWGSMMCKTSEIMTELAVRALYLSKNRGIILQGWGELSTEHLDKTKPDYAEIKAYADANIFFAGNLPHLWVFPQCKCIVHHGGSGTTHASIVSGKPVIITPVFLDQFTFARLITQKGVGLGTGQLQSLTPEKLSDAINKVTMDQKIVETAATVGKAARAEDGVAVSVKLIEDFIANQVSTGKFKDIYEEEWVKLVRDGPPIVPGFCGGCF